MQTIVLLALRSSIFLLAQLLVAVFLYLQGTAQPFFEARKYWVLFPLFANAVVFCIMTRGGSGWKSNIREYWGRFSRLDKHEVIELIGIFAVVGIIATLPNMLGVVLLWGNQDAVDKLLFPGIPGIIGLIGLLMPVTQALCELPFYYGHCYKRTIGKGKGWFLVVALFLMMQHVFLPFIMDYRYIAWRIMSFALISIVYGFVYVKKTRLRPYVLISHGMLDLPVVVMSMM